MSRNFAILLFAPFVFISLGAVLSSVVAYKKFGVPDSRREEYDAILAEIKRKNELLQASPTNKLPRCEVPETVFDFGMLDPHSSSSHSFEFKNTGEGPLSLEVLDTSCKCTTSALRDNVLLPGETTLVTLTWNTGYKDEDYEQKALIKTNDPLTEEIELTVKGQIKAELVMPEFAYFANADLSESSEGSITFYSQLWENITVLAVESDLPAFNWEPEPLDVDAPELSEAQALSAMRINLKATTAKRGKFNGTIKIKLIDPNGGAIIEKVVSAEGKVRAPIRFYSPEIYETHLDLGTLDASREHQFHLVVRTHDTDRKLEVLDFQPSILKCSLEPMTQAGSFRLSIVVPAGSPTAVFNLKSNQGYVKVGDPEDPDFSNWFPMMIAVVKQ